MLTIIISPPRKHSKKTCKKTTKHSEVVIDRTQWQRKHIFYNTHSLHSVFLAVDTIIALHFWGIRFLRKVKGYDIYDHTREVIWRIVESLLTNELRINYQDAFASFYLVYLKTEKVAVPMEPQPIINSLTH